VNPDTESENELICEKLLGWKKLLAASAGITRGTWIPGRNGAPGEYASHDVPAQPAIWQGPMDPRTHMSRGGMLTPEFTNWMDAGLILDAFVKQRVSYGVQHKQWNILERGAVTVWLTRPGGKSLDEYRGDMVPEVLRRAALGWINLVVDDTEF
jgi:hypothetical protein